MRASTTIHTLRGNVRRDGAPLSGDFAVIELKAADASAWFTPDAFRDMIRETLTHIEGATTLTGLAAEIAARIRT